MKDQSQQDLLKNVVALCKRRGFVYPGSELYGGFANTYSYGPNGAQLKKNIRDLWWKRFAQSREDMVGMDGPILLILRRGKLQDILKVLMMRWSTAKRANRVFAPTI